MAIGCPLQRGVFIMVSVWRVFVASMTAFIFSPYSSILINCLLQTTALCACVFAHTVL